MCAALGVSPALGVIHTGFMNSFVFDLADCFKCSTVIPVAFEVARDGVEPQDVDRETRKRLRAKFVEERILNQSVNAVKFFFSDECRYDAKAEIDADLERRSMLNWRRYGSTKTAACGLRTGSYRAVSTTRSCEAAWRT